jgi:hypothetical protein
MKPKSHQPARDPMNEPPEVFYRACVIALATLLFTFGLFGCASGGSSSWAFWGSSKKSVDPEGVQLTVMRFADSYISATADAYDKVRASAPTPEVAFAAQRAKVQSTNGALGNASEINPMAGLIDMTVFVTLMSDVAGRPWAEESFGTEGAETIRSALEPQVAEIWKIFSAQFTAAQVKELRRLITQWQKDHPDQNYVAGVHLSDLRPPRGSDPEGLGAGASIFAVVRLDPFSDLEPATREIEQSRVLAERMFFYARHMPALLAWQADLLSMQLFEGPEVTKLLADAGKFTKATAEFSDSTKEFAGASVKLADTIERFRSDLPSQQAKLIEQLTALIAGERKAALQQANEDIASQRDAVFKQMAQEVATARDAALKQASAEIATQRGIVIEQLNTLVKTQQDLLARNMQDVTDRSIDRLFSRAVLIVLVAAGALVAGLLLYRLIAMTLLRERTPTRAV